MLKKCFSAKPLSVCSISKALAEAMVPAEAMPQISRRTQASQGARVDFLPLDRLSKASAVSVYEGEREVGFLKKYMPRHHTS